MRTFDQEQFRRFVAVMAMISAVFSGYHTVADVRVWGDTCASINTGCTQSTVVPCNNATCVSVMSFPTANECTKNAAAKCDDGTNASYFSAFATTGWANCAVKSNGAGVLCEDTCLDCSNINLWKAAGCGAGAECIIDFVKFKRCGKNGGTGC